jgi:hypothetical protein
MGKFSGFFPDWGKSFRKTVTDEETGCLINISGKIQMNQYTEDMGGLYGDGKGR